MKLTSLATFMVASSFCIANFSLLNGGLKENKPTTIAYDCSFDPGEGSDEGIKIVTVEDGKRVSAPSFTFKDGYTFSYWWYIDPNEKFDFNTPIHEAMDFSASYVVESTPVTHNITYVLNGGSFNVSYSAPLTYVEGVYLALPNETNLSKLNYTFDGWYKSSDFSGERYTGIGTNNTLDLTFYAKWKEIEATSYSVIFNSNGGTINSGLINSYKEGSETILPSDVTRDGYIFSGWYLNSDFTGDKIVKISVSETGNKTYYAKWSVIKLNFPHPTYRINYINNGGNILDPIYKTSYKTGEEVTLPKEVNKDGYLFVGWYLDSRLNKSGPIKEISKFAVGDFNFYAKYIKDDLKSDEGYINIGINGHNELQIEGVYPLNKEFILPTSLTQEGYKFLGYYDNALYNGEMIKSVTLTEKVTNLMVYPAWEKHN